MIAAASAGAWLGAGVVVRWPRRKIQIGMGDRAARRGGADADDAAQRRARRRRRARADRHAARRSASAGNFVLGALMMLGIGLYAPCMILVSLLGMNPTAAFPIMMGSCAFLMPISSVRFVRTRTYDVRAALGLALGGLPAVLIAAYVVKSLPLDAVRWLVVVVVDLHGAEHADDGAGRHGSSAGRRWRKHA